MSKGKLIAHALITDQNLTANILQYYSQAALDSSGELEFYRVQDLASFDTVLNFMIDTLKNLRSKGNDVCAWVNFDDFDKAFHKKLDDAVLKFINQGFFVLRVGLPDASRTRGSVRDFHPGNGIFDFLNKDPFKTWEDTLKLYKQWKKKHPSV